MIRARGVFALLVLILASLPLPASAVTYGDFVDSPQIQYPEVIPVWAGGSLCTGTLIEQQIVLTAAHCVYGKPGPIQVAVGGSTLNSGRLIDVTATWYHPRYDAAFIQNDIALLYLKEAARVSRLASLPSPTAKKSKNFTLAGWGDDQNRRLTGNLSAINLNDHSTVAAKIFRRSYNPRTMIGAGRYFADEDLYGGGCEGDSGGPLYKGRNGSTRIVMGVTSWGAEGCVSYKPTIFTQVSYYVPELRAAMTAVKNRAVQSPLPTGRATPAGVGPTTTAVATTTTTTTVRPSTTTTTTLRQTTTTTRSTSPLSVLWIQGQSAGSSARWSVGVRLSTDSTALPQRVCWTVTVNGVVASNIEVSSSDLNGPSWTDLGGGCANYARTTREWDNSYWAYVTFQFRGASYDPLPYVLRTWTARASITDTLGRSVETSTWTGNL